MTEPYPIIDVTDWPPVGDEMMGTKPKYWLHHPAADGPPSAGGTKWLFKHKHRVNSEDDWSEKIASELAAALGLPRATVELARRDGQRGIISRDVVAEFGAEELIPGNRLLVESDPNYPAEGFYRMAHHTLDRVFAVFTRHSVGLPAAATLDREVETAADLFTGYLLFDAWIGNTDRHHENWAVLKLTGKHYVLAPSYDHAASLGHNVPEAVRAEKLTRAKGSGVAEFVASPKVRSAIYKVETDPKPVSPLDAFHLAATQCPAAARAWADRLARLTDAAVTDIVNRVPGAIMTDPAKRFANEMLRSNRARLLASTG